MNVGDTGIVTSVLRPSGKARFNELLYDVVSEGDFIDSGTEIEIKKISGTKIVVSRKTV